MNNCGRQSGRQGHPTFSYGVAQVNQKHIKSVYYIRALYGNYTIGMSAGSSVRQSWDYVIARLKEIREEIEMLQGMFSHVKKYARVADAAEERINTTLYELTGDTFYKPKKEESKHS